MGCIDTITATKFPKQSDYLGRQVDVIFHYAEPRLKGVILRDDLEAPYETIIWLENGRYVRSAECQWSPK